MGSLLLALLGPVSMILSERAVRLNQEVINALSEYGNLVAAHPF